MYSKKRKQPLIIVATTDESEIPIDSEKSFVEKVLIDNLEQEQRCDAVSWLIKSKQMKHQVDIPKIAKMCSDFVMTDLETLVLHAMKNHFKKVVRSSMCCDIILTNEDFMVAFGKL